LIPILTEKETELEFIDYLRKEEIGEIVLLFVVDRETQGDLPAVVIGEKLKKAEAAVETLRGSIKDKVKSDHVEWGKWIEKVENISKLEKADSVIMISTKETQELLPALKERNINVELFKLSEIDGPEKTADGVQ